MQEMKEEDCRLAVEEGETFCLYLYTPLCGTCQVASRMLSISLELFPDLKAGKMNMNYVQTIAESYEIESVPCLLLFKEGQLRKKIYAFQSVPYLYGVLKEIS
ncbi:thioredoxin [Peribacillus butanolivorans]|uniref:thioredoxin family protein n=1 Tax=Peribacillus butanolivorans TaxID=421767 RepID=UPI0006A6F2B5|nr:thioredoxin family protein [Peribacillus butanolivorans]KON67263.1 thioredoxin [Peribacillus butanolivorans]